MKVMISIQRERKRYQQTKEWILSDWSFCVCKREREKKKGTYIDVAEDGDRKLGMCM